MAQARRVTTEKVGGGGDFQVAPQAAKTLGRKGPFNEIKENSTH